MPTTVLTPQQLAERWKLDVKSIYSLIASGEIPTLGPLKGLRRPVHRIPLAWVEAAEQVGGERGKKS